MGHAGIADAIDPCVRATISDIVELSATTARTLLEAAVEGAQPTEITPVTVAAPPGTLAPAEAFLEKVDFDDDGTRDARRLYPLGRAVPVVLDPDHGFGEPTLTSGVRSEAVGRARRCRRIPRTVAEVYDIDVNDVDAAVQYEHDRVA